MSEAGEIARSGATSIFAKEQGEQVMKAEKEKAGDKIEAAWRRRQEDAPCVLVACLGNALSSTFLGGGPLMLSLAAMTAESLASLSVL